MRNYEIFLVWTALLLVIGILTFVFHWNMLLVGFIYGFSLLIFLLRKQITSFFKSKYNKEDSMKKAVDYFNKFWAETIGTGQVIVWKSIFAKEGYFGDEKLIAINAVRPNTNTRIITVVGFNPIRIVGIKETVKEEDTDPFKYFTNLTPLPTKSTDVIKLPEIWRNSKSRAISKMEAENESKKEEREYEF